MHAWASFFLSERRLGLVARVLLFGAVIARRRRRRQVSRRNSYSDRDMFEGGEDEEDVPMKASLTQPHSREVAPSASRGWYRYPPPVVSGLHVLGSNRLFTVGVKVFPAPLPRPRLFSARRVRVKTLVSLVERVSITISMLWSGHEDP